MEQHPLPVENLENRLHIADFDLVWNHFWTFLGDGYRTSLIIPAPSPTSQNFVRISILDSSGSEVNSVAAAFEEGKVGSVEIDDLIRSCKFQAGLQHGQIVVGTPSTTAPLLRFVTADGTTMQTPATIVTEDHGTFFPIRVSEQRRSIVALMNRSEESVPVTVRLFSGNRSPDTQCILPPFGCRVLSLVAEFPRFLDLTRADEIQGYIRVRTRSPHGVAVQLLEQLGGESEAGIITSVT